MDETAGTPSPERVPFVVASARRGSYPLLGVAVALGVAGWATNAAGRDEGSWLAALGAGFIALGLVLGLRCRSKLVHASLVVAASLGYLIAWWALYLLGVLAWLLTLAS